MKKTGGCRIQLSNRDFTINHARMIISAIKGISTSPTLLTNVPIVSALPCVPSDCGAGGNTPASGTPTHEASTYWALHLRHAATSGCGITSHAIAKGFVRERILDISCIALGCEVAGAIVGKEDVFQAGERRAPHLGEHKCII